MVTMTSKCEFDRQNGVLKDYLPGTVFVHNTIFPIVKMTKIMKILILGSTISVSSFKILHQSGPQSM